MTDGTMFNLTYKAKKLANFLLAKTIFLPIKLAKQSSNKPITVNTAIKFVLSCIIGNHAHKFI